jgi:Lysylphosphatidylglycerol synthase TM region
MPAELNQRCGWLLQALILGVAVWSLGRMHADASRIPLGTVVRSRHLILAALTLSLENYAIRALRWRAFLADLGDSLPVGKSAMAYVAGFAFALSPGKVGEVARARYCAPIHVTIVSIAATLVAERFQDAVAMMLLALLALTAGSRYTPAVLGAGILVAAATVALVLVPWEPLAGAGRAGASYDVMKPSTSRREVSQSNVRNA